MNTKMLDDAINGIRPELIEEAGNINQHELKNNDAFDGEVHVQGVEIYHRPIWKNILAMASAFIIVGGAVAGGVFMMKKRSLKPADTVTDTTAAQQETENSIPAEAEEATEAAPTEVTTDISNTDPDFVELQLHEAPHYAETYNEAKELADEHSITIPWNERHKYIVDTKHYAELLQSDGYDINSLEAKSYIYHIMLNSYLYYDTAKGTVLYPYSNDLSNYTTVDFQVDLDKQECYNKHSNHSETISDIFIVSYFLAFGLIFGSLSYTPSIAFADRIASHSVSTARSTAGISVEKNGCPDPPAKNTTSPASIASIALSLT